MHDDTSTARQLSSLRDLLGRLAPNPFYGPRLAAAGLDADGLRSLDQLRGLEPVTKEELLIDQEAAPPFGHRAGVETADAREVHLTSGTSGLGQEAMVLTAADVIASGRTWLPAFAAAGLAPGNLFATFYPATVFAYGRSVLSGGREAGVPVVSLAGLDRGVALSMLRLLRPVAIGARPALFALLEEGLASEGLDPRTAFGGLRSIIASGLTGEQAVALQDRWGVVAHEVYGMSQAGGVIAATGPEGAAPGGSAGTMYVNDELFLVEAVDPDTLEPVTVGEAELLLTCLTREGSPILRLRTRDRVDIVAPTTPDGRVGLRVGSIGRWDDMIKLRGNNVWPGQLDAALLGFADIADYRAEVHTDERGVEQLHIAIRRASDGNDVARTDEDLRAEAARRVKATTNVRPASVDIDPTMPEPELKPRRLADRRHR